MNRTRRDPRGRGSCITFAAISFSLWPQAGQTHVLVKAGRLVDTTAGASRPTNRDARKRLFDAASEAL